MRKILAVVLALFAGAAFALQDAAPATAMELGTRFTSDVPGYITGIKYYKAPGSTANATVTLWTSTGTVLAQYAAQDQTSSGWQVQMLTHPIAITPGTTYVVSRHKVAADPYMHDTSLPLFATERFRPPLHAPQRVAGSVANSVYANSTSVVFPTTDAAGDVYYVDVLFQPGFCVGL